MSEENENFVIKLRVGKYICGNCLCIVNYSDWITLASKFDILKCPDCEMKIKITGEFRPKIDYSNNLFYLMTDKQAEEIKRKEAEKKELERIRNG
jgi:DNA-directed RNA polymerase subunit RPC12/RpoP